MREHRDEAIPPHVPVAGGVKKQRARLLRHGGPAAPRNDGKEMASVAETEVVFGQAVRGATGKESTNLLKNSLDGEPFSTYLL